MTDGASDLVITEADLEALRARDRRGPKCLLCHDPVAWHEEVPPLDDFQSQKDRRHFLRLARKAHRAGKSEKPGPDSVFDVPVCVKNAAVMGVCGCKRLIRTKAELAAFREAEEKATVPRAPRSVESETRSRMNQEMRRLRKDALEVY